jgi:sulfotransferase
MDQAPLVRDDHEPTAEANDAPRAKERAPNAPGATAPTIHFVAGLPRTGSTALVTLLHQNPRILGAPVSGLGQTVRQTLLNWDRDPHHQERPDHGAKMRCVRALLDSYHPAGRPLVIDKQRA